MMSKARRPSIDAPSIEIDNARLNLASGQLQGVHTLIGKSAASRVDVSGPTAQWKTTGSLRVGGPGEGLLSVDLGGKVTSGEARIGTGSAGGKVIVGAGSTWENGSLAVGFGGVGSLVITNGGKLSSSGESFIGGQLGSGSYVTVDGAGIQAPVVSEWRSNTNIYVGGASLGTLNIRKNGFVAARYLFVGNPFSGTNRGVVNIESGGGYYGDFFSVGWGEATVEGGGVINVMNQSAAIGYYGTGSQEAIATIDCLADSTTLL